MYLLISECWGVGFAAICCQVKSEAKIYQNRFEVKNNSSADREIGGDIQFCQKSRKKLTF